MYKRNEKDSKRRKNINKQNSINYMVYDTIKHNNPKAYAEYIQKVVHAKAKVDNAPPRFNIDAYLKPKQLISDVKRVREIDKENMDLLKALTKINRFGGMVDCWRQNVNYKTNTDDQQIANKRIMKENKELLKRIQKTVSAYNTTTFIEDWKRRRIKLHITKKEVTNAKLKFLTAEAKRDYCMFRNAKLRKNANPLARTRCFFEIEITEIKQNLGRIVFELYVDVVPQTCANFEAFCRGTNGLSYKNTPFHRIVTGYWCQGGDITEFNGIGGTSIYGDVFEDENFDLRHAGPGVLSTYKNNDKDGNNSKFNLTFTKLATMDGRRVVFGKVISNLSAIYKIEEYGTKTGKPIKSVIISNCGILQSK